MEPKEPYDWEREEFNRSEDERVMEALEEELGRKLTPQVAWHEGDQEYYPVWSTTLYEQDQIWATKFGLRTAEDRRERLAQEAKLYILIMGIAHEDDS